MCKTIVLSSLFALALFFNGCGSNSTSVRNNINGNWTATLNNQDGSVAFQFSATFAQATGNELNVTNLTYTTNNLCSVPDGLPAVGSFTATGSSNGWVTGTFTMTQIAFNVGGVDLSLQGSTSNGAISGQWTVSGLVPPCNGSGSFTMQPTTAR